MSLNDSLVIVDQAEDHTTSTIGDINLPEQGSKRNDFLTYLALKFDISPWTVVVAAVFFYATVVVFILACLICCKKLCCDNNVHEVFHNEITSSDESDSDEEVSMPMNVLKIITIFFF